MNLKKWVLAVIAPKANAAKIIVNVLEREDNAHLNAVAQIVQTIMNMSIRTQGGQLKQEVVTVERLTVKKSTASVTQGE